MTPVPFNSLPFNSLRAASDLVLSMKEGISQQVQIGVNIISTNGNKVVIRKVPNAWSDTVVLLVWATILCVAFVVLAWIAFLMSATILSQRMAARHTAGWYVWGVGFAIGAFAGCGLSLWGMWTICREMLPFVVVLKESDEAIVYKLVCSNINVITCHYRRPLRIASDIYSGSGGGWYYRIALCNRKNLRVARISQAKVCGKDKAVETARAIVALIASRLETTQCEERIRC